jgi:hypothetical protein
MIINSQKKKINVNKKTVLQITFKFYIKMK